MTTFNWHELDRDNVLHWAVIHALVQKDLSEQPGGLDRVEIKMLINGVEFDGARLLTDLYESMSASFDRAVANKVEDALRLCSVEDAVEEIMRDTRTRVNAKLDELGFPTVDEDDRW